MRVKHGNELCCMFNNNNRNHQTCTVWEAAENNIIETMVINTTVGTLEKLGIYSEKIKKLSEKLNNYQDKLIKSLLL